MLLLCLLLLPSSAFCFSSFTCSLSCCCWSLSRSLFCCAINLPAAAGTSCHVSDCPCSEWRVQREEDLWDGRRYWMPRVVLGTPLIPPDWLGYRFAPASFAGHIARSLNSPGRAVAATPGLPVLADARSSGLLKGRLRLLSLNRYRSDMSVAGGGLIFRPRVRIDPAGTAVITDAIATVVTDVALVFVSSRRCKRCACR